MAESLLAQLIRKLRIGRRRQEPRRQTEPYPRTFQLGVAQGTRERPTFKPVARNLRYFAKTPYARRAINSIKDPIANLEWEIVPVKGVDLNATIKKQIEIATYCFDHPNHEDSFRTLLEQTIEDYLAGAAAIETEIGSDPERPLWMWPVDGLSIQIFALWDGSPNQARFLQTYGYGSLGNLPSDGILLNDQDLIYIKPNPTTSDPFGFGRLEVAFLSIARQLGAVEFAGLLASNAKPTSLLNFAGVDGDRLEGFRQYWRNEIEGRGMMPITGMKEAEALRLYPDGDDALYLKWQEFCIREIGTAFDLSPQNFGIERDVNRNTSEVSEDRDWDQAIKPTASALQSHFTRQALHRKLGFYQIEFKFVGLDREDEKATAEIYQIYYKNNAITPNEQRERLGMEPSDNEFADMTAADVEIAVSLARGAKEDTDTDLPKGKVAAAPTSGGKKRSETED